ncbi:MAG: DUF6236 family protein [Comamonas sp.]|nr:DUF6236 family protein [Comamonas sp.]
MRDNALYFPYISVQNDSWTIKTLLYWDKFSSIVPMDHAEEPEQLSPFMQQLVREQLVEQIFPAHYLYEIPDFEKCFIKLVSQHLSGPRFSVNKKARVHTEKLQPRIRVHAEKLGNIPEFLIEHGLASRVNWAWYDMDTRIANLFMAYLASCLGSLSDINAAPVTNQAGFARMFGNLNHPIRNGKSVHHGKARDVILRSILPTPDEKVTLDQLLRFKDDHGHLLPALRRSIESHCATVAILPSAEDRLTATENFIGQCKDEVSEIADAMRPTWKKISFGSISPLFGAGFTLHATSFSDELAYAGGAFTFAACAYQAISSIRGSRMGQINKPLAYVAHARSGLYA